jgi:hypothetical protein
MIPFEVAKNMADYIIQLAVTITPDVDPQDLQAELNHPDVRNRLGEAVGRGLVLPHVPAGKNYPKAGTFAVGSVTVEKK